MALNKDPSIEEVFRDDDMDIERGVPVTHVSHEDIIRAMNTCCLCGDNLKFKHVTDFNSGQVKEAAKCPSCGIKSKVNTFKLQ